MEAGGQAQFIGRREAHTHGGDGGQVGWNRLTVLVFTRGVVDALVEAGLEGSHGVGDGLGCQRGCGDVVSLVCRHALLERCVEHLGKVVAQVTDARELVDR